MFPSYITPILTRILPALSWPLQQWKLLLSTTEKVIQSRLLVPDGHVIPPIYETQFWDFFLEQWKENSIAYRDGDLSLNILGAPCRTWFWIQSRESRAMGYAGFHENIWAPWSCHTKHLNLGGNMNHVFLSFSLSQLDLGSVRIHSFLFWNSLEDNLV